jgi:hypothetical protein
MLICRTVSDSESDPGWHYLVLQNVELQELDETQRHAHTDSVLFWRRSVVGWSDQVNVNDDLDLLNLYDIQIDTANDESSNCSFFRKIYLISIHIVGQKKIQIYLNFELWSCYFV